MVFVDKVFLGLEVGKMGGRTDGSTMDFWQCGRFYGGWAIEWVVERLVLLGNHGRTGGSILR